MKLTEKKLKKYNYESIIMSIITALLGIIIILFSKNILNIVCYLIGGVLIVNGLFKIYYYLKYEGKYGIFNYDLSFGILAIILGIIFIIFKSELQSIFRIIIGLIIIYEGILNISLANKIYFVNKKAGIISLLLSVLTILCGILIIIIKGIVVATIGYILIGFALINIIESIIFKKNLKKLKKYLSDLGIK